MQRATAFIGIVVLAFGAQFILPWWAIALVAFILGALLGKTQVHAFGSGFLAIFVLWTIQAFLHFTANDGILASRMGTLLGGVPGALMPWITGLIGGIVGGLSAWTGFLGGGLAKRS